MEPSIWLGAALLGLLIASCGVLGWWLFLSHLPETIPQVPQGAFYRKSKLRLLYVYSGMLLVGSTAGIWDTAWHMRLGGFQDDFWWAPHIVIYGTFGAIALVAGMGLVNILALPGSIRARVRAEPLIGAMFLFVVYLFLAGPVDEVWHKIYGVDISGLSLPHVLLILFNALASFTVVALLYSLLRQEHRARTWIAVLPMVPVLWSLIAVFVGDWEFGLHTNLVWEGHPVLTRPGWTYFILGILPTAFMVGAASGLIRRAWAAPLLVGLMNLWSIVAFWVLFLLGNPFPLWATPLYALTGALGIGLWQRGRESGALAGGLVYSVVYLVGAIAGTLYVTQIVSLSAADITVAGVGGLVIGLVAYTAGHKAGGYLTDLPERLAAGAVGAGALTQASGASK